MQIFISHASKDKVLAQRLAQCLAEAGFHAWSAEEHIYPGDNWAKKVGQALEESELMVVLVTPHAFASERLTEDIQYALTAPHYQGRLIPVVLGAESEALADAPWILRKLDAVRLAADQQDWQAVVDKVRRCAG